MNPDAPDPWWPLNWVDLTPIEGLPAQVKDLGDRMSRAIVELPDGQLLRVNHTPLMSHWHVPPYQVYRMRRDGKIDERVAMCADLLDVRCCLIDIAYPEVMPSAGRS